MNRPILSFWRAHRLRRTLPLAAGLALALPMAAGTLAAPAALAAGPQTTSTSLNIKAWFPLSSSVAGDEVDVAVTTGTGSAPAPTGTVTVSFGQQISGTVALTPGPSDTSVGAIFFDGVQTPGIPFGVYTVTASYKPADTTAFSGSSASQSGVVIGFKTDSDLAVAKPGGITTDATSPGGATVNYPLPTVTDPDDASPPVPSCSPAPGTVFAIGTTTVNCSATDTDDSPSTVSTSFTITVMGTAASPSTTTVPKGGVQTGGGKMATSFPWAPAGVAALAALILAAGTGLALRKKRG
jgi:hypothetical protein